MTDFLVHHVWLIPLYSLVGSLLSIPWAIGLLPTSGQRPAAYVNIFTTLVGLIHALVVAPYLLGRPAMPVQLPWLQVNGLELAVQLQVSTISLGALSLIAFTVLLAQCFALGYMEKDWSLARFYGLMGFFEAALSGLALSDSLVLSYGLLEMLTLSTYLLVGFWYAQPLVVTAARDAFLTKRVGDVFLLMGVVALACYAPGLTFSELANWAMEKPISGVGAALLGLAIIAGPVGKCAQFPLNLWLDEAMEGPNPASILRNSVVVAAGAYVLIQLQPVLTLSPVVPMALIVLGVTTALGSSLVSIAQIDIKRSLSHSTSAYFGLVFMAVGFQRTDIALLLILAHGLPKALMYMSVGSIIITTNNQDITEMGGLGTRMPATTIAFVTGALSLVALMPLGMFWTLHRWVAGSYSSPWWVVGVLALVNLLSALNLTRLFRLVFLGEAQAKTRRSPEVAWPMAVPMVILTVVTVLLPLVVPDWLLSNSASTTAILPTAVVVAAGILGIAIGWAIAFTRQLSRPINRTTRVIQDLLAYDFYLDRVYRYTVVLVVELIARLVAWVDRYVVDGAVNFVGLATLFSGQSLRYSASGQSQAYVITILVGLAALVVVLLETTSFWDQVAIALQQLQTP